MVDLMKLKPFTGPDVLFAKFASPVVTWPILDFYIKIIFSLL